MTLLGETIDLGIGELLVMLAQRGQTGRLTVTTGSQDIYIYLRHGKIALVNGTDPGLRLGSVLTRLGAIDERRMAEAIQLQAERGGSTPIGRLMVEMGWLQEEEIRRAAEEQAIEAISRVILASGGGYVFTRDIPPPIETGLIATACEPVLAEATSRAAEMVALKTVLPPENALIARSLETLSPDARLTEFERRVMAAVESGPCTLGTLSQRVQGVELALWRTVASLRERGLLTALAPGEALDRLISRGPRTIDELIALGAAGPRPDSRPEPRLADILAGTAASEEEVAGITATARQVIHCFNEGRGLHAFGWFTDDYFRRAGPLDEALLDALRQPPVAYPPDEREIFAGVQSVRRLADGRVAAILLSTLPGAGEMRKVLVFAEQHERWLIDAEVEPAANPS